MTLRRTALQRKTELRRSAVQLRRRRQIKAHTSRAINRQRVNTGPSVKQRNLVAERANWCCEICGRSLYIQGDGWTAAHSFHHRQPRGMGGTTRPDVNSPANILLLCGTGTTGCHGRVEKDRAFARIVGWLVRPTQVPADVSVVVARREGMVLLTHDGEYAEVGAAA